MASNDRFDVSISLYDVPAATLALMREFLLHNLPMETDISITPSARSVGLEIATNHDNSD